MRGFECRSDGSHDRLCGMKLADVVQILENIAPTRYAESWDNVGLLVGDPAQEISGAMLTIDYTPEVACEAAGAKGDWIVAYLPPIFEDPNRITAGRLDFDAVLRWVA